MDIMIVRELVGGIYFGQPRVAALHPPAAPQLAPFTAHTCGSLPLSAAASAMRILSGLQLMYALVESHFECPRRLRLRVYMAQQLHEHCRLPRSGSGSFSWLSVGLPPSSWFRWLRRLLFGSACAERDSVICCG